MKQRPFLALLDARGRSRRSAAFVVHLALRGRTVDLGYKLGRARAEQARLREVKRVLSLEAASYKTPQRVEMVARTLLGMKPPPPERVIALRGVSPSAPSGGRRRPSRDAPRRAATARRRGAARTEARREEPRSRRARAGSGSAWACSAG